MYTIESNASKNIYKNAQSSLVTHAYSREIHDFVYYMNTGVVFQSYHFPIGILYYTYVMKRISLSIM